MQHFLTIDALTRSQIENIFQMARTSSEVSQSLQGCVIANLFFEPSTRTQLSFELAAKKNSAVVLSPNLQFSALQKGESLADTVKTVEAMGADIIVVRHKQTGAAQLLAQNCPQASIVNAGDGIGQHPTQALADLFTITQHYGVDRDNFDWQDLSIAIVGDSRHSRVANSLISAFKIMGCHDIRLVGPDFLRSARSDVFHEHTAAAGLKDCNVVIALRNQVERWDEITKVNAKVFTGNFGLSDETMQHAAADALLLHPGPVTGSHEITKYLRSRPSCLINEQVRNGVRIRRAILNLVWQQQCLQRQKIESAKVKTCG